MGRKSKGTFYLEGRREGQGREARGSEGKKGREHRGVGWTWELLS